MDKNLIEQYMAANNLNYCSNEQKLFAEGYSIAIKDMAGLIAVAYEDSGLCTIDTVTDCVESLLEELEKYINNIPNPESN